MHSVGVFSIAEQLLLAVDACQCVLEVSRRVSSLSERHHLQPDMHLLGLPGRERALTSIPFPFTIIRGTTRQLQFCCVDWNPPTVADTKKRFYETFRKPIPGLYNNVIQELLVQQHIMRYNRKYRYDEVRALLARPLWHTAVFAPSTLLETHSLVSVTGQRHAYCRAKRGLQRDMLRGCHYAGLCSGVCERL